MSGGSFNYLTHAAGDAAELGGHRAELSWMADALDDLATAEDVTPERRAKAILAARNTRDVARLLDGAERVSQQLADLWHDIEWWHSCDYGRDQAIEGLDTYQPAPPATQELPGGETR